MSIDTVRGLYRKVGEAIAEKRRAKGMSQAELGDHIGLTRASVANIETGRQNVLLHYVFLAAGALECRSVTELLPEVSLESLHFDPGEALALGDNTDLNEEERLQLGKLVQVAMRTERTKR